MKIESINKNKDSDFSAMENGALLFNNVIEQFIHVTIEDTGHDPYPFLIGFLSSMIGKMEGHYDIELREMLILVLSDNE